MKRISEDQRYWVRAWQKNLLKHKLPDLPIHGKSSGVQSAHGRVAVPGVRQPACVLRLALPSFFVMNFEACYKFSRYSSRQMPCS